MTAAEELADLRQRLAVFARSLRARRHTYHSVEAGLAVGAIADELLVRFVEVEDVAEPVAAYGEREPYGIGEPLLALQEREK